MGYRKLIALLVGLCIVLAPVLSNAAMSVPASLTHAHDQGDSAGCHSESPDGGLRSTGSKVAHSCCFNFVGSPSAMNQMAPYQGVSEPIPFSPSLSLASRVEGLFRPPRQNS